MSLKSALETAKEILEKQCCLKKPNMDHVKLTEKKKVKRHRRCRGFEGSAKSADGVETKGMPKHQLHETTAAKARDEMMLHG